MMRRLLLRRIRRPAPPPTPCLGLVHLVAKYVLANDCRCLWVFVCGCVWLCVVVYGCVQRILECNISKD